MIGDWGRWGSVDQHRRYLQAKSNRRARCPYCRNRNAATHLGMANGVCLTSGCELHMRRWARDGHATPPKRGNHDVAQALLAKAFVSVPPNEPEPAPTVTVEQIREALERGAKDARKLREGDHA